jgi:hypothetical protein
MEILLDLNKMSIEVAAGHLQAVESHQNKKQASTGKEVAGQLLLTEEQWKVRFKATSGEKSGGSSSDGGSAGHGHG